MTVSPTRPRRATLLAPFVLVLLVLAGWSVWWVYLAGQVEARLDARAEAMRDAGWTVAWADRGVDGWPFRTRMRFDALGVAAPSGHALAATELVAQANAWNPDKWVMVATDGLTLTRAGKGDVVVTGAAVRASVHGLTQRWPNVAIELARPVFTPASGAEVFPIAGAERIELYARPHRVVAGTQERGDAVDVLFRLIDARGRPDGPVQGLARDGLLTLQAETTIERADALKGANAAGIFAAWTRAGGRFVDLKGEVSAGDSRATLSSTDLSARPDGRVEGEIALKAVRPMSALAGLAGSGADGVNPAGAAGAMAGVAVAGALEGPASPSGSPSGDQEDIDLTLIFRDGRTWLGPFPLAPAPKLF